MLAPTGGFAVNCQLLDPAQLTELALNIYDGRRDRDKFFDSTLFSDPAWDLLLAAYCIPTPTRPVSVTALCHAAAVPLTTALRWLDRLCDLHFLSRSAAEFDHRVINVALTPTGKEQIEKYLNCHAARILRATKPITVTDASGSTEMTGLCREET